MVKFLDNNTGFAQWNAGKKDAQTKSGIGRFLWWCIIFLAVWWMLGVWMQPRKNEVVQNDAFVVENVSDVPEHNVNSDKISATVQGLRIKNIQLKEFVADKNKDESVVLLDCEKCFAEVGFVTTGTVAPTPKTLWHNNNDKMVWHNQEGVQFERQISAEGYLITVTDKITNNTKKDLGIAPYIRMVRQGQQNTNGTVYTGVVARTNKDFQHIDWKKLDKKSYAFSGEDGFVGFADQYWESVATINSPDQTIKAKKINDIYIADAVATPVNIAPGQSRDIVTTIFAGPRDSRVLSTVAEKISGINDTVDYGWFWFLAMPILWVLNAIHSVVMNYGVAIIIMTLILRLLMWPLTRKSYTSMMAMQKMQPEMQKIQKLYAGDKARLQVEMMRLYQTHKTSPMSGCLPMLIQIPIFFALYKALLISVPMRSAHFLWISDLAVMDPYFILPVLMGATMWLQQYLQAGNRKSASGAGDVAGQTQKIMRWMPVMFTVMFAWMPAGVVLYWTVSNILGIAQMYIIKRHK